MMQQKRNKGKRSIGRRIFTLGTILLVSLIVGFSLFAAYAVDEERDDALLRAVGEDTFTRFYYHAPEGESVEGLSGYRAVLWEEECQGAGAEFVYTPLEDIPETLQNAFIAIEDRRFYRHAGVDVLRTGKAVLNSVFHFAPRFGGSTITQQLIKNIGGEREQTARRKLKEMLRALSLERRHDKKEILEAYLNIVPMSENRIGVGAAARLYFGKTPSELSLAECAGIAAVTKAPALYAPEKSMQKYLARRALVLGEMRAADMISEQAYEEAMADTPVLVMDKGKECTARSWYTETVLRDVERDLIEKGYTQTAAKALLAGGGLRIYTAVDIEAQRGAERFFENEEHFKAFGEGFSASFVLLSPKDGNLCAIIGNTGRKKGNRLLNHATDTLRAPGSALKPIALYAPAIDEGRINEATVFDDIPVSFREDGSFWPNNADGRFSGLITPRDALARSKNTVAVSLYRMLGAEHIYACLSRLGVDTVVRKEISQNGKRLTDLAPAPLALGELTRGVTLLSLARAYLPLADEGRLHNVRSYLLVTDRYGTPLLSPEAEEARIFKPTTASVMTHLLRSVVEEGSADALSLPALVDTAGKTGTSGGARDRFFIGYTPYYLGGVWCGYETGGRAVEGDIHLRAFDAAMKEAHGPMLLKTEEKHFTMARGLRAVRVCADSGLLPSGACALDPRGERTRIVWLEEGDVPTARCRTHVLYHYSDEGKGILLSPMPGARQISLVRTERELPLDLYVEDAEYTCRPLGDVAPAGGDRLFYAALLPQDRYGGHPESEGRPFNALARNAEASDRQIKPRPIPEKKPEKKAPERKKERKNPLDALLKRFRRFGIK